MNKSVVEIFQNRLEDLIFDKQDALRSTTGKKASVAAIAKLIGVAPSSISKYRNPGDKTEVQSGNLKKIADYFNVSTDFLLGLTDTPSQEPDIRMISDYTGLSEKVIQNLHRRHDNSQKSDLGYWNRAHATDEMLWELTRLEKFCLTLSFPIIQKAQRKAANDIAKQIIENPKRLVANSEKAKVILQEINECISRSTSVNKETTEEVRKIEEETSYIWLLTNIVELLERNIPVQGSDEFDRFEAAQQYIEAYNHVMEKYPDNDLVEEQKSFLLIWMDLRFDKHEVVADK